MTTIFVLTVLAYVVPMYPIAYLDARFVGEENAEIWHVLWWPIALVLGVLGLPIFLLDYLHELGGRHRKAAK